EGGKLFGTHTEFYLAGCWAATLDAAAYMSRALGLNDSKKYEDEAAKVRAIIDQHFWNKQEQFFHNGKMVDGSFMPDATVLASIPIYLNTVTDTAKENLVSKRFASSQFSTDWGIRM